MRKLNEEVMQFLEDSHPVGRTANQIVQNTGLSFSTVRTTLNLARERGQVERDLDIGLNGHTLYRWFLLGAARDRRQGT